MSKNEEEIDLDNFSILLNPTINKGTAFTYEERIELGLLGLLPNIVSTIDEQMQRRLHNFEEIKGDFEKVVFLKDLRERNEVLYFKMLATYPEKFLPYVYTPMVGDAAIKFSSHFTHSRGIFFSYPNKEYIEVIVESIPLEDVQAIVMTDGSRILGLGDMGAGGMAIPIGKLDLYTVFGAIAPKHVLPICLDVGTNNQVLLEDPYYVGWKHPRITGKDYAEFIERVIKALKKRFPKVLLQWEDFSKENARPLLDRYRDKICSFNDDIEGTAASAMVAITTALKISGKEFIQQKIVILGGGSAGTGIADLLLHSLMLQGLSAEEAKKNIYIIDIDGLLLQSNPKLDSAQKMFAHQYQDVKHFDIDGDSVISLEDVVKAVHATILIGVSGQPGVFTKEIITQMKKNTAQPIIMPLSNPTSKAEAIPEDIIKWTDGKALIATGSPFKPVEYAGKTYGISQCNNVYIFPGLGLGLIAAQAKKVTVEMFLKAVEVVSFAAGKYSDGSLFPKIRDLRAVSKDIAVAVAKYVIEAGLQRRGTIATIEKIVDSLAWEPTYKIYKRKKR